MTLNAYFILNSVFTPVDPGLLCVDFKNNYVKINAYRCIQSVANIYLWDSSFWHYKVYADIWGEGE